ncbi:hypothetical protein AXX12_17945 [Anaerosporomusa subterranea]|uniref:FAD-dependent protein C-terminal domain-containing protein n=1 Tax=Anaerosporomusa subterranea TaxID=1794912 RepID=A0A154BUY4_ANASB|nr:hypothetical protein [Anaerosporomusa subterranea]KYZ77751.1 hypothetical protein AXX12_17945 [Anaerosporomusa subterranea]
MIRITDYRVPIEDETPLPRLAAKRLKLPTGIITQATIIRKALDARRKGNIAFVYTLDVQVNGPEAQIVQRMRDSHVALVVEPPPEPVFYGHQQLTDRPVIVGFGPAGMLAALTLAEHGYHPLVLEQGRDIDRRTADVAAFWQTGKLDEISNVQFGEGGAGTFSDGKLTTRVTDPRMRQVLDQYIEAGAPPEIRYLYKPHIGTDRLRHVVKNIRQKVIALGGEVRFEAKVADIILRDGQVQGVVLADGSVIACSTLLLGIGHSARDTYELLQRRGVAMEPKPFAIGVRIEHPQEMIDSAQYGQSAGHKQLSPADYALVYHDKSSGRTAYSFCMCPGGLVVAAASEHGGVVTNGMSLYQRASGIANSALVVNVTTADYGGEVLGGIEFQRRYEQLAFQLAGGDYRAPAQTVGSFLSGSLATKSPLLKPSYRPGIVQTPLEKCLPDFVIHTLQQALPDWGRKIRGFNHPEAVMTGVETRTSAPVRIVRQDFQSVSVQGLYPIGEGAGYAGGIMSASLDGMNAALTLMKTFQPPR